MKLRKITEDVTKESTYKLSDQVTLKLRNWEGTDDDINLVLHITKDDGSDYRVSESDDWLYGSASLDALKEKLMGTFRHLVGTSLFNTNWVDAAKDENSIQGFAVIEDQIKKAMDTDEFSKFYDEFKGSNK